MNITFEVDFPRGGESRELLLLLTWLDGCAGDGAGIGE